MTQTSLSHTKLGSSRWVMVVIVLGGLFAISQATIKPVLAYSCGDSQAHHCYAEEESSPANPLIVPMLGAETNIFLPQLVCNLCGTTFIDNEMWYISGAYWVEAGYDSQTQGWPGQSQSYFWGDFRPGDPTNCEGPCPNYHFLGDATPDVGSTASFAIRQNDTNAQTYNVTVTRPNGAGQWNAFSTNNKMGNWGVIMGQELAGGFGARAGNARFSYRFYERA